MRYLFLFAGILSLGVILVFVFLKLVRDLLVRDLFDAPSLPDTPMEQTPALEREVKSSAR
jgi:hypothetical protein